MARLPADKLSALNDLADWWMNQRGNGDAGELASRFSAILAGDSLDELATPSATAMDQAAAIPGLTHLQRRQVAMSITKQRQTLALDAASSVKARFPSVARIKIGG